jgi:hypothetical protein
MKSLKNRFDGEKELGRRLRESRIRAGLTQHGPAQAMGRTGRKAGNLLPGHGA